MKTVCFHNPNEENGYLSNWYPSDFTINSVKFTSMEQYLMYQKAVCFHDNDTASQILLTSDAAHIKALGRLVRNYNDHQWNGVRQLVIYEGLAAKFSQNPELLKMLKCTGDTLIAECAVKDTIWGIGLSMTDPDRFNQTKWKGANLRGYALMMIREKL